MFDLNKLKNCFTIDYQIVGNLNAEFDNVDSIFDARENSLTWVSSSLKSVDTILKNCPSSVIICDKDIHINPENLRQKAFIIVETPAIAFLRLVKCLYQKENILNETYIHPTAIVDPEAKLGRAIYVGPYSQIGKCEIGDNSRIESYSKINSNVQIGSNVLISEFCNIGGQGFGHIKNEHGELENMLHIGKVIIEDNVEIFPYCNVDRATLSSTTIKKNCKIDHYCHIGHNTSVGENTVITAKVVLCGGSRIGDYSWVGVGSIIKDKISVGNQVILGMGSCVTKDIPDNEIWFGSPAKKHVK